MLNEVQLKCMTFIKEIYVSVIFAENHKNFNLLLCLSTNISLHLFQQLLPSNCKIAQSTGFERFPLKLAKCLFIEISGTLTIRKTNVKLSAQFRY